VGASLALSNYMTSELEFLQCEDGQGVIHIALMKLSRFD